MKDRILELVRAVMGELDVDRVLTAALDGVIELSGAERGMILLFDPDGGDLLFEKARNLDRRDIRDPQFQVSRSIIRRVRHSGEPFFDPDLPEQDVRFGDSVRRLGLLAVICLPLSRDGTVFGVVYLDNRSRRDAFDEVILDEVADVCGFLSQAAFNALDRRRLRARLDVLEHELRDRYRFDAIVGSDPSMLRLLKRVAQVADTDATVLIEGESGTGKELIARALHFNSRRRDHPFLPINCGAMTESLHESELFGHERGAFTGAVATKPGYFEQAEGGTLFLDEVGEMSPALQVKFLRVLETGEYARVGGTGLRRADVRIVAATHQDLDRLVAEGRMRSDLRFRLNVVKLEVPPLRGRPGDVLLLAEHFLARLAERAGEAPRRLSATASAALERYAFPGNVRELQNALQGAVVMAEGERIELHDLPPRVAGPPASAPPAAATDGDDPAAGASFRVAKQRVVAEFECSYLEQRLRESGGNISRAARAAGIDVKNFYTKMKQHGIDAGRYKQPVSDSVGEEK